ncbi:MAG: tRNA (adenosine(37)-N6)-threonylcarbamoyltransferase complex transferase subunit TsaD [Pyrinomonadaceae bacterium]
MYKVLLLGIETSCDETAAAVVRDGREILSSVISSQIDIHSEWGGVVPEVASREHLVKIGEVVDSALKQAGVSPSDLEGIAVTNGPGLIGSLLVGVSFAKSMAYALDIPFVGINHIEGHYFSVEFDNGPIEYPALALIVSGGHTNVFYSSEPGQYKLISRTRDDAAGEAFDKASKMLGLGYPGGPIIEKLALEGDASKVSFPIAKISDGRPDFSFSGLKTALLRHIEQTGIDTSGALDDQDVRNTCASFQQTVVKSLMRVVRKQAEELSPKTIIVAGGVACNLALRAEAENVGRKLGIPVYFPSRHLSTDNAAMIAAAGEFHLCQGERAALDLMADVTIRLQNVETEESELRRKKVRYKL